MSPEHESANPEMTPWPGSMVLVGGLDGRVMVVGALEGVDSAGGEADCQDDDHRRPEPVHVLHGPTKP